jgi:quercetin dioxygenase-like cupin family protein
MTLSTSGGDTTEILCGNTEVPRLPGLSAAIISKNVLHEIVKLKAAPAWQGAAGRSSETLAKYSGFSIVLMIMKAGTQMSTHHADGWTFLYMIDGRIRIHFLDDQRVDLGIGEVLTFEPGLEHDVHAVQESTFLLTIAGVPDAMGVCFANKLDPNALHG